MNARTGRTIRFAIGIGALLAPPAPAMAGDEQGEETDGPPDLVDPLDEWSTAGRIRFDAGGPIDRRDVELRFGGRFALDFVRWDRRNSASSGVEFGALRPLFEADVGGRTQFRAELDLDDVDSRRGAFDLWVRQEIGRHLAVQLGQVRVAMGSEYATREENSPLIGRSFTSYLTGRHDLGLLATVDPHAGLHFEGAATLGSGFGLEGEGKDDPLVMGRAVFEPLRQRGPALLRGFFVGASMAWQPSFRDELLLATPYQTPVLTTRDLRAGHAAWGLFEVGWRHGPFRSGFELARGVLNDVGLPGGGHHDVDQLTAWTAYASVFLGGGSPQWNGGRWTRHGRPKGRIDAERREEPGWIVIDSRGGPIELALRYSNADIDRSLFQSGLTSYDPSTQEVRVADVNLVFHLNPGQRFSIGAARTIADHELSVFGGANRDTSFLARFEIDF
jgi:hypothetical protein